MLWHTILLVAVLLPASRSQFLPLGRHRHHFGPLLPSYHSSYTAPTPEATYGLEDGYGPPKKQACLHTVTYKSTLTNYVTKTVTAFKTIAKTKIFTVTAVRKLIETDIKTETKTHVKTVTEAATKYGTVTQVETKFDTVTETTPVLSTVTVKSTEVETLTATQTTVVLRSTTDFVTATVERTVTETDKCDPVTITKSYHDLFLPRPSDHDGHGYYDDFPTHDDDFTRATLTTPTLESTDYSQHDSKKGTGGSSVSVESTKKPFGEKTKVHLDDQGVYKLGTPTSKSANFVSQPTSESKSTVFHEEYPDTAGFSFKDFDPLNGFPIH